MKKKIRFEKRWPRKETIKKKQNIAEESQSHSMAKRNEHTSYEPSLCFYGYTVYGRVAWCSKCSSRKRERK